MKSVNDDDFCEGRALPVVDEADLPLVEDDDLRIADETGLAAPDSARPPPKLSATVSREKFGCGFSR